MTSEFDLLYHEEDRTLVLHTEDPDLPEIKIDLPKAPPKETIDNYGLPPEKQYFKREEMPRRLKEITKTVRRYNKLKETDNLEPEMIYSFLESNKENYMDEIKWIRKMIHRRYHGCWQYINGKPVYINRWYWFFLNQWDVNNETRPDGLPDYRSRDWKWWTANLWLYESTKAPFTHRVKYTTDGEEITKYFGSREEMSRFKQSLEARNKKLFDKQLPMVFFNIRHTKGNYMVDTGRRLHTGLAYPKGRRDGATYRAQCTGYCIATEGTERKCGIQSKSEGDGDSVFDNKLIKPWQKLWFFFKPMHDGGSAPKSILNMQSSSQKKNSVVEDNGIGSWIDHRSSGNLAYDGEKLHFIHHDEVGKKEKGATYDVVKRYRVVRKCLTTGADRNVIGWALLTSTTNKMEGEGGAEFYEICKQSMYNERNSNGQTLSGLVNLFIPSYDGLEGFVDEYGNSVLETPDKPIKGIDGAMIDLGSKDYINNKRRALEQAEDWEGLNEEIRMYPIRFKECFRADNTDSGFNLHVLNERISELRIKPPSILTYDCEWETREFGPVKIVDNAWGRFRSSFIVDRSRRNQMKDNPITGHKEPAMNNRLYAGADPFKFNQTKYGRKSNGAGTIFYPHDTGIDHADKPRDQWVSNQFTTTYNERVADKDEYAMDMLKMCILHGAKMYPEVNVPIIDEKFKEWGFGGYLLYYIDARGNMSPMSGRQTNNQVKQDIFGLWMTYINLHGMYEKHTELLEECMSISGPEEMKDYDLFTAGGYSLMAADIFEAKAVDMEIQNSEIVNLLDEFDW